MFFNDKNKYCLKNGYNRNTSPNYYVDSKVEFIYQPNVYELAKHIAERSKSKYIIDIGSGNGEKLNIFGADYKFITVDFGENRPVLAQGITTEHIQHDLNKGLPIIDADILRESVIIFSDVLEHLLTPENILKDLASISGKCNMLVISTPDRIHARGIGDFGPPLNPAHVCEWSIDELDALLKKHKFPNFMIGYTENTNYHLNKNNILVLCGKLVYTPVINSIKTLAIINCFNEADILGQTIEHLLRQGLDVHITDNWSDDGSYEIAMNYAESFAGKVSVSRFPEQSSGQYEWARLLDNTIDIAAKSDYDWIMHCDADEFRESPWKDISLSSAFSFVDACGYNSVDFTVIDFRPTVVSECKNGENPELKLRFFEFGERPGHFLQIKAWKNQKEKKTNLSDSGGHEVVFEGRRVFPLKFLLKHYPLRSQDQGYKKINKDRLPRFDKEKSERGWHTQYDKMAEQKVFLWNPNHLCIWNDASVRAEYMVEFISGVNIVKKDYMPDNK